MKNKINEFSERFGTILPQAIFHFEENVRGINAEDQNHYEFPPEEWFDLENNEKYEFLMNDDYWVRHWSIFLTRMLIDEIYKGKEFKFNLN